MSPTVRQCYSAAIALYHLLHVTTTTSTSTRLPPLPPRRPSAVRTCVRTPLLHLRHRKAELLTNSAYIPGHNTWQDDLMPLAALYAVSLIPGAQAYCYRDV